ncbi:MAG: iron uptake protein [Burkholderiaceae bacterium]|nr:iron uptake protein [Burkholderiaceae bacterium]
MATTPLTSRSSRPARAAARLAGVLLASFGFVWGLVALGVAGLTALGVDYHEAEVAMMLLAVAVLLPLFLCGFASPRQGRVMALLTGGAALMAAAAWLLQRALLA